MPKTPNVDLSSMPDRNKLYNQMRAIGRSSADICKVVGGRLFHLWDDRHSTLCDLTAARHPHVWYSEWVCGKCYAELEKRIGKEAT